MDAKDCCCTCITPFMFRGSTRRPGNWHAAKITRGTPRLVSAYLLSRGSKMRLFRFAIGLLFVGFVLPYRPCAQVAPAPPDRIRTQLDTSEPDAVLAILDKRTTGRPVTDADWQALFATEPYLRLKKREAAMHREFTDEDFKKFVLSDEL